MSSFYNPKPRMPYRQRQTQQTQTQQGGTTPSAGLASTSSGLSSSSSAQSAGSNPMMNAGAANADATDAWASLLGGTTPKSSTPAWPSSAGAVGRDDGGARSIPNENPSNTSPAIQIGGAPSAGLGEEAQAPGGTSLHFSGTPPSQTDQGAGGAGGEFITGRDNHPHPTPGQSAGPIEPGTGGFNTGDIRLTDSSSAGEDTGANNYDQQAADMWADVLSDYDASLEGKIGQTYADEARAGRRSDVESSMLGQGVSGGGYQAGQAQVALGGMSQRQDVMNEHYKQGLMMKLTYLESLIKRAEAAKDRAHADRLRAEEDKTLLLLNQSGIDTTDYRGPSTTYGQA